MRNLEKIFEKTFQTKFITFCSNDKKFNKQILHFFSFKLEKGIDVEERCRRLKEFKFFFPKQVHGNEVIEIRDLKSSFFEIEADGVLTRIENLFVGVRTADCVPVLISVPEALLVSAVHAGWRGSIKKILYSALEKIKKHNISPEEIFLKIGPHIRVCCYEVGEKVIERLKAEFENWESFLLKRGKKFFLDLEKLNLFQALEAGIPEENIKSVKYCTACLKEKFWSHRIFKNHGFQINFVGIIKKEN